MSGKQAVLAVLIMVVSILAVPAAAQDQKNEISGVIGRTFISDQGIHGPNAPTLNPFVRSGRALTFEVNFAHRLMGTEIYALSLEVPAVFNLDEDLGSGGDVVPEGYKQIFVTPAARLTLFPATRVTPWVSLGAGFGHFTESKTLNYSGTNPGGSSTSGVVQGGLGLDVSPFQKRFSRFSFRGEVRDFYSGTPKLPLANTGKTRQHNYFVGGGVVWHF